MSGSNTFQNPDGSFFNQESGMPPRTVVPATGNTITMGVGESVLYVNPAGTIAALTVKLPPGPRPGDTVEIGFRQIVTALTLQDAAAGAITGAATAGAVGVAAQLRFVAIAGVGTWVRWR
jgi:hypothetical protein